jgi:hypothetical protein
MNPTPRTDALLRLTCAAGAVITTAVIGLSIHSLARTYDVAAETQARAQPLVVAQAQPR